jgi:serine O-acetyltransferase
VVGAHARIGANAVVVRDVPAGAVVVGVPGEVKTPGQIGRQPAELDSLDAVDPAIWI